MGTAATEWSETVEDSEDAACDEDAGAAAVETSPAVGRRPGLAGRILGRLLGTLSTLAVAAIVALAVGLTVLPAAVHGHTLTVLSGSMLPRLPVGSVVVDRPVDPGALRVGDIVTYASGRNLITHRVAAIKQSPTGPVFTTKGDANRTADSEPVQASQIRGRLWYDVPYIGIVRSFLLSRAGLLAVGGGGLLIAAIWFLIRLNRPSAADDGGRG